MPLSIILPDSLLGITPLLSLSLVLGQKETRGASMRLLLLLLLLVDTAIVLSPEFADIEGEGGLVMAMDGP